MRVELGDDVVATRHAIKRIAERMPGASRTSVEKDVAAALEAGRYSPRLPAFVDEQRKRRRSRRHRYCWNEERTVCFVIAREEKRIVVVTVIAA